MIENKDKTLKIGLFGSYSTVPRLYRLGTLLKNNNYSVTLLEWDRESTKNSIEFQDGIMFKRLKLKSNYGTKSILLFPIWFIYIFSQLLLSNFDLIIPHNFDSLLPTFLASKIKKYKIVYDFADFYSDAFIVDIPIIKTLVAFFERILIKKLDGLILVSEGQIKQIHKKNLPKNMIYFYNIPFENINDLYSSLINNEDFIISYAGTLTKDRMKFILNVVKAIDKLPIKFIIAGFGEYERIIQKICQENNKVVFIGKITHYEIMKLTKISNLVLLPYDPVLFNNSIGLPNKLFEAMSCGTPVLASKNTYMGKIVNKEKIGFIVDFNNIIEVESVINYIYNNRLNLSYIRNNSLKLFDTRYNPIKISENFISFIKSL